MKQNITKYLLLFSIVIANSSSAQEVQLTRQPFDHFFPKFSPDGNWVLYERVAESGDTLIYKVPSEGGEKILLSADSTSYFNPEWSGSGLMIAVEKVDSTGYRQICLLDDDGSGETILTSSAHNHYMPQFSPDDTWITYYRRAPGYSYQIFKIPAAGGDEIHLGDHEHACNAPQFSPDGNWILYQERDSVLSDQGVGVWRLYKMPAGGGEEIRLTDSTALHEGPHWSPDGNKIVYEYRQPIVGGSSQIYRVSAEGGMETALTTDPGAHESPRWSPDGDWIAYERRGDPYQRRQIYLIHVDGGEEISITANDSSNHYRPRWSPDGKWVVYMRYDKERKMQIYKSQIPDTDVKLIRSAIESFHLYPNIPNPFNAVTVIRFCLARPENISLTVYNILGDEIAVLVQGKMEAGVHSINWNAGELPTGIYLCRLKAGSKVKTRRLLLIQ